MAAMKKMAPARIRIKPIGSAKPKTLMPKTSGTKPGIKTPMPKIAGAKAGIRTPLAKKLTGAAAITELQRQVSPKGVKKSEANAKKAIDKKYPGLYKSGK